MGKPIIAASINYRLNGYGFLASSELAAAGVQNLGLHDQRLALEWVQVRALMLFICQSILTLRTGEHCRIWW
jgi:hypothetical protein